MYKNMQGTCNKLLLIQYIFININVKLLPILVPAYGIIYVELDLILNFDMAYYDSSPYPSNWDPPKVIATMTAGKPIIFKIIKR